MVLKNRNSRHIFLVGMTKVYTFYSQCGSWSRRKPDLGQTRMLLQLSAPSGTIMRIKT